MMGRGMAYGYGAYRCMGGGLIPMLLIIIVIGLLVFFIAKRPRKHREYHSSQAMTILNERLAKGEIAPEEYEKLKNILKQ